MNRDPLVLVADLLRAYVLVAAAVLTGVVAKTVLRYLQAWRLTWGSSRGLLPLHVWTVGSSYVLFLLLATYVSLVHLGERPGLDLLVNVAAFTLGLLALVSIFRFEDRRVKRIRDRPACGERRRRQLPPKWVAGWDGTERRRERRT